MDTIENLVVTNSNQRAEVASRPALRFIKML